MATRRLAVAAWFLAPFALLLAAWAFVMPAFDVNPRLFPQLSQVVAAAREGFADGSLVNHIAASLLRVVSGTALAIVLGVPMGIAMGVSPAVSTFVTPLLRFFSVLAGIAWIPIATLWFGYGFGAITFVIFNAVFFIVTYNTLLGVATIPMPIRNAARSLGAGPLAMLYEVLLPGALPNIVMDATPQLSLFAFHLEWPGSSRDEQDAATRELLERVTRRGKVFITGCHAGGRFLARVCVLSFRTRQAQIDACVEHIAEEAGAITGSRGPSG